MREFLNRKTFTVRQSDENGNIAFGIDHADWIEIPSGTSFITKDSDNGLHYWNGVGMEAGHFRSEAVVWQREQPDAVDSPNNIAKKEYLVPQNAGGFMYKQAYDQGYIPDSWIEIPEGAEIAVLFEPKTTSSRSGELFFWKDNGDTHYYTHSDKSECQRPRGWYSCKGNMLTTLDEFLQLWAGQCRIVWKRDQPATSLNDIARTAEDHREHNLSNELNDLCAEFGCPPGADRMRWLRDHLRGTRKPETLYHYSASINTARGTVAYDGVITFHGRITGIEDYQQARAEIAKDGNVAPEQVNVHSLSIVS